MTLKTRKRLMDRKIVELLIDGKSSREVMRTLNVGDRKVRKAKLMAEGYGYLGNGPCTPLPPYPEALFPDGPDGRESKESEANTRILARKPWIIERLETGWHPITVYEEIGISVSRSSFYRFLHRHSLYDLSAGLRKRVVPEIRHSPGEALLLDWGKLRDVIDPVTGKKRILWAFVGVLGYSRYMMVRLVWTNETRLTLTTIESMLREIGGVPGRVTSDNPKCFSIEASLYEPILNPAFERMAGHYGMRIECLPPADPEKKGKVERMMPFVRRLYEAHGNEWHGIEESQSYMDRKVGLANERTHGSTRMKPTQQLIDIEVEKLKALPALAYEPEEVSEAKVRRDGHVRFDNKYYSVDENLIEKEVLVLGSNTRISIYHNGKLVETHERILSNDPSQMKSTKLHHRKPWEREMENGSMYRSRAQKLGPDVDRLVLGILNQGEGFIDTRKIWGILALDKTYSAEKINLACGQALELGSLSYQMVKSLIKLLPEHPTQPTEPPKSAQNQVKNTSNKFVRPMSVYEEQLKLTIH
jgi:hypothetical protein